MAQERGRAGSKRSVVQEGKASPLLESPELGEVNKTDLFLCLLANGIQSPTVVYNRTPLLLCIVACSRTQITSAWYDTLWERLTPVALTVEIEVSFQFTDWPQPYCGLPSGDQLNSRTKCLLPSKVGRGSKSGTNHSGTDFVLTA